ncbi:TIGR02757 family protein [Lentiprolixibacter aurantiacus]|uniref:TIGR02757 family protein n=1 Tax=Lentiprolixibacter aurantiacus TaxID=2993939 RepID=A0AAE3ML86_9FLAO|nr:TIGR02757 family protein [Lentiprolixibacter aurantiacus]MCX2719494.1 TIGR02757 family protein [Lentiprolixibacter aurantiacus]
MTRQELKDFLDAKVVQYNTPEFLETDPICIPHRFDKKEDIEISGFLTATIAWGNRKSIIKNARQITELIDLAPHDFVMGHTENDLKSLDSFVHRTFNGTDLAFFVTALRHLYSNHNGLEGVFTRYAEKNSLQSAITAFKGHFFELKHPLRTTKHISDPARGSAAKRINMFLRWMVRKDPQEVDFGLWKGISPAALSCPLDVHSGNVARKLGLLKRKQNDARAVLELDLNLRKLDPEDPVKYDFALFGLGVFEKF